LDEESIKLKSAKREVAHLERLVSEQGTNDNNAKEQSLTKLKAPPSPTRPRNLNTIQVDVPNACPPRHEMDCYPPGTPSLATPMSAGYDLSIFSPPEHAPSPPTPSVLQPLDDNIVSAQYSKKYLELELDLKKRLRMQAMLETDCRKLNNTTKSFFNQLNQQKSETSQIIQKLQTAVPPLASQSVADPILETSNQEKSNDVTSDSKLEEQKKQNRKTLIQYTVNRMRNERSELQQQIRMDLRPDTRSKTLAVDTTDNNATVHSTNSVHRIFHGSNDVHPTNPMHYAAYHRVDGFSADTHDTGTVIDLSESMCVDQEQSITECFEDVVKVDIDSPFSAQPNGQQNAQQNASQNVETPSLARKSETTSPVTEMVVDSKQSDETKPDSPIPVTEEMTQNVVAEVVEDSVDLSDLLDVPGAMVEEEKCEMIVELQKEDNGSEDTGKTMDDEAERERREREQLEQDLMDDYTQSESFSGVGFLQNDFLEQYQKHIESISEQ